MWQQGNNELRQACDDAHRAGHHVVAIENTGFLLVDSSLAQLHVSHKIPRPRGDETRGDDAICFVGIEYVAGQLLLDEPPVGLVGIERTNDIIAIGPGMIAAFVFVVAVRIAVVRYVEPVASPAFAITRRIQQTIHEPQVGIGGRVVQEAINFLWTGRKPKQVEAQATNQREAVCFSRRFKAFSFEGRQHEGVDGRAYPILRRHLRDRGSSYRRQRPPGCRFRPRDLTRPVSISGPNAGMPGCDAQKGKNDPLQTKSRSMGTSAGGFAPVVIFPSHHRITSLRSLGDRRAVPQLAINADLVTSRGSNSPATRRLRRTNIDRSVRCPTGARKEPIRTADRNT